MSQRCPDYHFFFYIRDDGNPPNRGIVGEQHISWLEYPKGKFISLFLSQFRRIFKVDIARVIKQFRC